MRVLVITGDKKFGPGHERYELQKSAVEVLEVVYWGRGSLWPTIPEGHFDVVTVQDPFWRGLFGWFIARRLGVKFNVQVHTSEVRGLVAWFVLGRADSVRVVSEKIKQQVSHPNIHVLPVYVDVERFKHVVRSPEQGMILWVGRFEEEKDPIFALEVLTQVPGAHMVMLGLGSLQHELKTKSGRLNLSVLFPGWKDPAPYLAKAAVVLCTSRHESFGASIVEALAAGVPVVAPDVGIAREAGAIVVPRDNLARAVQKVLEFPVTSSLKLKLLNTQEWQNAWLASLQ